MKINYLDLYENLLTEAIGEKKGVSVQQTGSLTSFLLFDKDLHVYAAAEVGPIGKYKQIEYINGYDNAIILLLQIIISFFNPDQVIPNRKHVDLFEYRAFVNVYKKAETELIPKSLQHDYALSLGDSEQHKNFYLNQSYSGNIIDVNPYLNIGKNYLDNKNMTHSQLEELTNK